MARALTSCILLLAGLCGFGHAIAAERTRPVFSEALVVLEKAVNSLADPTADYRDVLGNARAQLNEVDAVPVRNGIDAFLRRTSAGASEMPCNAEFMRDRARRELWRLKDVLLDWNPRPVEPRVCNAVPLVVDLARPPVSIDLYGYDFDQEPLELFVEDDRGFFRDVTTALTKKSRFRLTIDLGEAGVRFGADSRSLELAWGHLIRYWIPIIQPETPLCPSSVERVPAGKELAYTPLSLVTVAEPRDARTQVLANVALDYDANVIDAMICMTARGQAAVTGCGGEQVYATDRDRVVEAVLGKSPGAAVALTHRGARSARSLKGSSKGPVDTWNFQRLAANGETGRETRMAVRLPELKIVSTLPEGCVSPIQYLEAERQQALSPATVRRLEPGLRHVDPAILKLRPRYAAPSR